MLYCMSTSSTSCILDKTSRERESEKCMAVEL